MEVSSNEFTFPVVGTTYLPGMVDYCIQLLEGTPLTLELEPTNKYDSDAVKVLIDDQHIGYVPNKGYSCSRCWYSINNRTYVCNKCGHSDSIIEKGLASRIKNLGVLEKEHGVYIKAVKPKVKSCPIEATIVWSEGPL